MSPRIEGLSDRSSLRRGGLNHQVIEDYLKTIYMLAEEEAPVSTSRIATARSVKPASVTGMVQRLAKLKLVNYEKHYGVSLTPAGEKIALEVIRHHRLIELYLIEALGFSWDEVHEQADVLEHVISEKMEERMAAVLNYPDFDPHGDPIPGKDGSMVERDTFPLLEADAGSWVYVARIVNDANSEMLRYLSDLGLTPGVRLQVLQQAPFDGPVTIQVAGAEVVVGHKVGSIVLVEAEDPDGEAG